MVWSWEEPTDNDNKNDANKGRKIIIIFADFDKIK